MRLSQENFLSQRKLPLTVGPRNEVHPFSPIDGPMAMKGPSIQVNSFQSLGIFNEKKSASIKQRLKGGVKMPGDVKSRTTINSHLSSQVKLMPPEPLSVSKKAESA